MFIDFQYTPGFGIDGLTVMADFPFIAKPLAPGDIKETIFIQGSNSNSPSIQGQVDTDEQA